MALFEGFGRRPNSRTDMRRLFVSEGISPAEEWLLDSTLPVLFSNQYGRPGQTEVVIGKGMACSVAPGLATSFEKGVNLPVLTLANGANNYWAGVAPYNLCRGRINRFEGNQPSILRRQYVELPWFRRIEDAARVNYGAVFAPAAQMRNGLYIKVANTGAGGLLGKYDLYDPLVDDSLQIVGMIMAIENDVEPWGWFKWVMWDEVAKRQDDAYINKSGQNPPWPFDPEYRNGRHDMNGYLSQYTTMPTGIPGLTDGENRRKQSHDGVVPAGTVTGVPVAFNVGFTDIIADSVNVIVGGVPVLPVDIQVNAAAGIVTYVATQDFIANTPVLITFEKNFYGTPPGWDSEGFTGMVRLLLK